MIEKHTPGPWVIGVSADNGIHCVDSYAFGRITEICEVWGVYHDKTEDEVSKYNALLISAAPDLLEAMNSAPIPSKYHGANGFDVDQFLADYAVFSAMSRAAIAKARGEA